MQAYGQWAADSGSDTGYQKVETAEALRETGDYPVYTPEELVDRALQMGPGTTVMLHPLVGGLDPKLSFSMLELFERKVIPALVRAET